MDMSVATRFPATVWIWRCITSRIARRIYLSFLLFLLATTVTVRVYTFILTQRIQAVLSGLERLRIDQTTEEELLRTVPYLVRGSRDIPVGTSITRGYYARISNESIWLVLAGFASGHSREPYLGRWPFKEADWLGFRYLGFRAGVVLLDGKVSGTQYGIANEFVAPAQAGEIVSVKSIHGRWSERQIGFAVRHTDDESPQYLVGVNDEHLYVTYTFDAPREQTSRAFQVQLSCFWSLRGCIRARQVAPLLWQDKEAIQAAVVARLKSNDPCPDRILASRVRYLLDVDLLLLEVLRTRDEIINEDGANSYERFSDYRVIEVLRGASRRTWNSVRSQSLISSPTNPLERMASPALNRYAPGSHVLMFANHYFYSCAVVPATPSALAAVRNAMPAPKRREDEVQVGLM